MSGVVGDFDSHAVGSRNDKIDFGKELDGLPIVQNLFGRQSITVKSDRWRGCLASLEAPETEVEAHAFFSGQEAVDSLGNLRPDLLITDVVMPGMSGIEAAIIARSKLPMCEILG